MQPNLPTARSRRARRLLITGAAACATAAAVGLTAIGPGPVAQAAAVTYDPLAKALGFNTFVENETVLASTEAEGPMATGGDLVIQGSYNVDLHSEATFTVPGDARPTALVAGGRIDFGQDPGASVVRVIGGGFVKVGDLTGTRVRNTDPNGASVNTRLVAAGAGYDSTPRIELTLQEPSESVGPASPIDFADAFADFRADAADLFACDAHRVAMTDERSTVVPKGEVAPGQRIWITLTEGVTNVLEVTGEDLNDMADLTFTNRPSADTPLLINVDTSGTGGELDWQVRTQAGIGGAHAPYLLWNFADTTRLTIASGDSVEGSILAPDADFTDLSPTNVEGQIVAENASFGAIGANGGEVHYFPFAATLECETDAPTATTWDPSTGSESPSGDTGSPSDDSSPSDASEDPSSDSPSDGSSRSDAWSGPDYRGGEGPVGPGGILTTTGNSLRPLVIAAAALLAVGAGALLLASRRRKAARSE